MSTKVVIACENHLNDRYILEPVVTAALQAIGVASPRVTTITNPQMSGFTTLLSNVCAIIHRYHKTVSALVIAFDLDGEDGQDGRPDRLVRVSNKLASCDSEAQNVVLLGCQMEAEVYAIWGHRAATGASWAEIRAERDPKEFYFDALLNQRDALTVDGGRTRLMRASLKAGWSSLRGGCLELEALEHDLRSIVRPTS